MPWRKCPVSIVNSSRNKNDEGKEKTQEDGGEENKTRQNKECELVREDERRWDRK
jgi:hypothetical protein